MHVSDGRPRTGGESGFSRQLIPPISPAIQPNFSMNAQKVRPRIRRTTNQVNHHPASQPRMSDMVGFLHPGSVRQRETGEKRGQKT